MLEMIYMSRELMEILTAIENKELTYDKEYECPACGHLGVWTLCNSLVVGTICTKCDCEEYDSNKY